MSAKRANKLAGRETLNSELARVSDSVGLTTRDRKAYSGYTAAEKARIDAANEGSGGPARGRRESNGS
jgi:hypothetical protein